MNTEEGKLDISPEKLNKDFFKKSNRKIEILREKNRI